MWWFVIKLGVVCVFQEPRNQWPFWSQCMEALCHSPWRRFERYFFN